MNDPKAFKDCVGTFKTQESTLYHGIAQGFSSVVNHKRTCYVWQNFNGYQHVISVNTETLIVRPKIKM